MRRNQRLDFGLVLVRIFRLRLIWIPADPVVKRLVLDFNPGATLIKLFTAVIY